jgi:hypothetical protein
MTIMSLENERLHHTHQNYGRVGLSHCPPILPRILQTLSYLNCVAIDVYPEKHIKDIFIQVVSVIFLAGFLNPSTMIHVW